MFRRILIANRGEIALRIIKACEALGIESVAAYSEADRESPYLARATRAVCIGGPRSSDSYRNMEAMLQAANQYECQAIHPGYGFLSENALFAEMCTQQRTTFIGPSPRSIRLMGDKWTAKQTMRAAGLPTIPGSEGLVENTRQAREVAQQVGYPVLFKATAGGGGKGMRICQQPGEIEQAFAEAGLEADKSFGNSALYLEKFITGGRHIEFQVLADHYGAGLQLGERECSIQRRHQKLVEESPSVALTPEKRLQMGQKVVQAILSIGYHNAGTLEFLLAPSGELYFMEMNTRLQVEHPVTEMVTGVDIVCQQLRIAANEPISLRQNDIVQRGHAIECRINAEEVAQDFRPAPGTISACSFPTTLSDGKLRFDTHVQPGYVIPPYYDSMIGKLIVHAPDRGRAIRAMEEALAGLRLEGIPTTVGLHRRLMQTPFFQSGQYNTQSLAQLLEKKG